MNRMFILTLLQKIIIRKKLAVCRIDKVREEDDKNQYAIWNLLTASADWVQDVLVEMAEMLHGRVAALIANTSRKSVLGKYEEECKELMKRNRRGKTIHGKKKDKICK